MDALVSTGADVLSVDWTHSLSSVRDQLPAHVGVQGNLDPFLLTTTPELVAAETTRILREMKGKKGHVFNLGHGILPETPLAHVERLIARVRSTAAGR